MLDPEDELFDRKLANHLVSLYYKSSEQEQQEMLVSRHLSLHPTLPRVGSATF